MLKGDVLYDLKMQSPESFPLANQYDVVWNMDLHLRIQFLRRKILICIIQKIICIV